MSEPWIDLAARQLAYRENRRVVVRALFGALLGWALHLVGGSRLAAAQSECSFGEVPCSGSFGGIECVNASTDSNNCGGCGIVCPADSWCSVGRCQGGFGDGNTQTCGWNEVLCPSLIGNYECVDTSTDDENCGVCGLVCPGGSRCVLGECDCGFGEQLCLNLVGSAECTNLSGDNDNCGSCGVVCPRSSTCVLGKCECGYGETFCPGLIDELVCVNTARDDENCGKCGNRCDADEMCSNGKCASSDGAPSTSTDNIQGDALAPFGIDTVTSSSLNKERFAEALPAAFPDHALIVDATTEETIAPLYQESAWSETYLYRDTNGADDQIVVAIANVSELSNRFSVQQFMHKQVILCTDSFGCVAEQYNVSNGPQVCYFLGNFPLEDTNDTVHNLVWGERNGRLIFTLMTLSSQSLKDLAEAVVENATELAITASAR